LIGFVMGLVETRQLMSPESRLFFVIGFLGSFTTFSTFSFETFELFQDGEFFFAIVNMVVSIIAGLFAVWLGYRLSSVI
jgi:CrcB protein